MKLKEALEIVLNTAKERLSQRNSQVTTTELEALARVEDYKDLIAELHGRFPNENDTEILYKL